MTRTPTLNNNNDTTLLSLFHFASNTDLPPILHLGKMKVSHASIHPVEEVPTTDGMPDTAGGLSLRIFQFIFAADALSAMAFTSYFPNIKHLPSMSFGERE
ncbi:hypothetical protein MTR_5g033270 [Medicago truncatula]|uniref:Uncharacterized protein n=1 Tax=Medicago truncatula TaxID=3880 RepID=G7JYZ2_MEDTR|nr:hypothetical protein MTR_5g033270 [Medicago truncatula]